MRKTLFYLSLVLMAGLFSCRKMEKEEKQSSHMNDSIAMIEAEQQAAEEARLDSLRQDSLRQDSIRREANRKDSIAQEEKMRLKPSIFREGWWDEKTLKRLGFKKIKEKETPYEEVPGMSLYEVYYTRTFNGRKIDLKGMAESCHGMDIIFHDNRDKDRFMQELKKISSKDQYNVYYVDKYYFEYRIEGNKIEISGCG